MSAKPDKNQLGRLGEDHALALLLARGDKLTARNLRCPHGEIDLITWSGETLVFSEVRSRKSSQYGTPAETVTPAKQAKLRLAAEWYLARTFAGLPQPPCRFDLVWVIHDANGRAQSSGVIEGAF